MAKRKTNIQFVRGLIADSNCPTGMLIELFIIEAIGKYANACAKADPALLDNPLINGAAWKRTAEFVKEQIDSQYGRAA